MVIRKTDSEVEMRHSLQQLAESQKLQNPALERLVNKEASKPDVHQAYDRMHHRHNRS